MTGGESFAARLSSVADLIDRLVDLAKGLQHHLARLKSMPALARQKLDDVLVEIDKTFMVVDDAVKEHLAAALDPGVIDRDPNVLIRLAGPDLPIRVERDRGHCHEIGNIYWHYLNGILDRILPDRAKSDTADIFKILAEADDDLFRKLAQVAESLQERAQEALERQLIADPDGARQALARDAAQLIGLRQKLQAAHLTLVGVRNAFLKEMMPPPAP